MGKRFRSESSYRDFIPENSAKMIETATALVNAGTVLVNEESGELNGMLGYVVFEHPLSAEKTAGELFWWVEPDARGTIGLRLMNAMKREAKAAGALKMQMVAPSPEVAAIYQRLGFKEVETTFQRAL